MIRGSMSEPPRIVVLSSKIEPAELARLVGDPFEDMVKFVVDIEQGVAAVGGELHADAQDILIERGSRQESVWGGNYFPGRGPDACIQYTSLINIRPARGNRAMVIEDTGLREKVRAIVFRLIGAGEPLS